MRGLLRLDERVHRAHQSLSFAKETVNFYPIDRLSLLTVLPPQPTQLVPLRARQLDRGILTLTASLLHGDRFGQHKI